MRKHPLRGQVWICDFGTGVGSEQSGIRPCLILNQKYVKENTCIVLPASNTKRKDSITYRGQNYLLHQVRVVDTQRLLRLKNRLPRNIVDDITEELFHMCIRT